MRQTIIVAAAILLAMPVWGRQAATNVYSIDKEIAMGRQLSAAYEKQVPLNGDPELGEYINRLGQNIVHNSDAPNLPFTFRVVDLDEPGGVAFPGGVVFINKGTVAALDNEAELTFALAQEIAHIAARQGTRQASGSQIVNLTTVPRIYAGGVASIPQAFLQFSADQVLEADLLGIQYLYKAGYDPNAAVTFLQKIQSGRLQGTPNLFNPAPSPAERIAAIQRNIRQVLPARTRNLLTTPEFNGIKAGLKK